MAGNYVDVPGNRIPYDLDGTAFLRISSGGSIVEFTPAEITEMNDEANGVGASTNGFGAPTSANGYCVVLFPRLMDVTGLFIGLSAYAISPPDTWQTSTNTTNGLDGVWTNIPSPPSTTSGVVLGGDFDGNINLSPFYRTHIWSGNLTGIRAIRFTPRSGYGIPSIPAYHIYGKPSSGENADRLEIWHPTLDERVSGAYFDWGDAQRTSNDTRTFRIKNLSPTLTANGVSITFELLTDATPSYDAMHTFSDGGAYSGTISLGSLAPAAVSSIIIIRRDFPANAVLGLWAGRINTTAASWT